MSKHGSVKITFSTTAERKNRLENQAKANYRNSTQQIEWLIDQNEPPPDTVKESHDTAKKG